MQIKGYRGPQEIAEILEKSLEWDFDIFKLEILTEKRYSIMKEKFIRNSLFSFFLVKFNDK